MDDDVLKCEGCTHIEGSARCAIFQQSCAYMETLLFRRGCCFKEVK
jgi:hypothetical protein